jgi:hypothetical protein
MTPTRTTILIAGFVIALGGRPAFATPANAANQSSFSPWDKFNAATLAEAGRHVLDGSLYDFPSARIKNVYATSRVIAESSVRAYFICGEIEAKNGFGAYTGWTHFILASENANGPISNVYFENQAPGAYMYFVDCTQLRGDPMRIDTSADWGTALLTGKSRYDIPAQR